MRASSAASSRRFSWWPAVELEQQVELLALVLRRSRRRADVLDELGSSVCWLSMKVPW
jgi:hypothetical protein